MKKQKAEVFSGVVHSIIFENAEDSFYIFRVVLDQEDASFTSMFMNTDDPVTVKGNVPGMTVKEGAWIPFEGRKVFHPQYGQQIEVTRAPLSVSSWTPAKVISVLSTDGVGQMALETVLNHAGPEKFSSVLADADELAKIPGITPFDAMHIASRWCHIQAQFRIIDFLNNLPLSRNRIERIWKTFGDDTEEILTKNPWALVKVHGIGFRTADDVARKIGADMESPFRVQGAVHYAARQQRSGGHLYLGLQELMAEIMTETPSVTPQMVADALKNLHKAGDIILDQKTKPGTTAIYNPWFHFLEKESAQLLFTKTQCALFDPVEDKERVEKYVQSFVTVGARSQQVTRQKPLDVRAAAEAALEDWSESSHIDLSDQQREGALNALTEPVSILTGLPGTGKCVVGRTLVSGFRGFSRIDAFLPEDLPVGEDAPLSYSLDTSKGVRKAAYVYNGGVSDTIKITTKSGYEIEGTPEHPIRVVSEGEIVWRRLGEVVEGDVPVLIRGHRYSFGRGEPLPIGPSVDRRAQSWSFPTRVTPELATALGYLTSEGSVVDRKVWQISAHDPKVRDFLTQTFEDCFGIQLQEHRDKRYSCPVGVRFCSVQLVSWFRQLGVRAETSHTKSIPDCILESPREVFCAYLRGLFEGDGSVDPQRCTVEYSTASEELAYQLHVLLLALGVVAHRGGGGSKHRLSIYGGDYDRFREVVGFHFTEMPERTTESNTNTHLIYNAQGLLNRLMESARPKKGADYNLFYRYARGENGNERNPSREHVERLIAFAPDCGSVPSLRLLMSPENFYDPVTKVETGRAQVVDFGVPRDHEFLSGGFISHNTTTLRAVVSILMDAEVEFLLVAPTGIAAKRQSTVTGAGASTVHRAFRAQGIRDSDRRQKTYVGVVGKSQGPDVNANGDNESWSYSQEDPYPAQVIIVDESSMVDQHVLYRILNCTAPNCRVVFVGDPEQLPSVGPGNVLRDLTASHFFPTVFLDHIYRQEGTSAIVRAAHRIYAGKVPDETGIDSDFTLVELEDESEVQRAVLTLAGKLYAKRRNFQVISPRHEGTLGVTTFNSELRSRLNPKAADLKELRVGQDTIREGDRIMVVKNDYSNETFNGDTGKVNIIDTQNRQIEVKIHGDPAYHEMPRLVRYDFNEAATYLRLAYCATVHKVQGQEFDYIIMPLVKSFGFQLQRNLFYTAITRARKKVILVGHKAAMMRAVLNDRVDARNTLFQERLILAFEGGAEKRATA